MINIKRAFLPLLLTLFLPVPEAHSAAEEGNMEFFPIAMVADREETLLVCGNYYADQSNEEGYWFRNKGTDYELTTSTPFSFACLGLRPR